jgi:hypothetical protein
MLIAAERELEWEDRQRRESTPQNAQKEGLFLARHRRAGVISLRPLKMMPPLQTRILGHAGVRWCLQSLVDD